MQGSIQFGDNRTGIASAPRQSEELLQATRETARTSGGDTDAHAELRLSYAREADPLGSVPELTKKKSAKTQDRSAVRAQVLVDRLAERLAFERTGTRLYEALLVKHAAYAEQLAGVPAERLEQFHAEEAAHFRLLTEALQTLGADPSAQTPAADLVGVQGMGLVQAMTEPRTNFVQALNTILVAELADNDGWQALIGLARQAGFDEMAERFMEALEQEEEHLRQVRAWLVELTSMELGGRGATRTNA